MNAVTYRYSAAENPTRLNQQEADCRSYANEHGLTITEVFTDTGHSRHGLHRMLDAARREDVTGLIVTDLARLGTKYADHVAVVQQLHDAGRCSGGPTAGCPSSATRSARTTPATETGLTSRFAPFPTSGAGPSNLSTTPDAGRVAAVGHVRGVGNSHRGRWLWDDVLKTPRRGTDVPEAGRD